MTQQLHSPASIQLQYDLLVSVASRPEGINAAEAAETIKVSNSLAAWRLRALHSAKRIHRFSVLASTPIVRYFTSEEHGKEWEYITGNDLFHYDDIVKAASARDGVSPTELASLFGSATLMRRSAERLVDSERLVKVVYGPAAYRKVRYFTRAADAQHWMGRNPSFQYALDESTEGVSVPEAPKTSIAGPRELFEGVSARLSLGRVGRDGDDDHEQLPSRRGDKLYYRDGRVEDIK